MTEATCFAPSTVANVAVGFDILGFSFPAAGDEVTVKRSSREGVVIDEISSLNSLIPAGDSANLPKDPNKNCATAGLVQLLSDLKPGFGFNVRIKKGIPLGSGMGGSAASAVGALVAANALLDSPLPKQELLSYALIGEAVASGSKHPDNVTPCLYGGLTLIRGKDPIEVVPLPTPRSVFCVLVHPHARIDTRMARGILQPTIPIADYVRQSANLAAFVAACFQNDVGLMRRSLVDLLIEPQRAPLLPAFNAVKERALMEGAIGCSFSGSGPSLFAWAESKAAAERIRDGMEQTLKSNGVTSDAWVAPLTTEGAKLT